jgi:hypothetical protein
VTFTPWLTQVRNCVRGPDGITAYSSFQALHLEVISAFALACRRSASHFSFSSRTCAAYRGWSACATSIGSAMVDP